VSSTSAVAGAVQASVALVVDCAAEAVADGVLADVAVAVASGDALGAFAVVPAHPAIRIEAMAATTSLMRDIMKALAVRAH
jgi:DNA recombination-dependent growth factor C